MEFPVVPGNNPGVVERFAITTIKVVSSALLSLSQKVYAIWHAFVEMINNFYNTVHEIITGSLNREIVEDGYEINFPEPNDPRLRCLKVGEYIGFTPKDKPAISQRHREKILELIEAQHEASEDLARFLSSCAEPKFSRSQFSVRDWQMLDLVNLELYKEFAIEFAELCNSRLLHQIREEIRDRFHFDYYEAIVAEVFSRVLAPLCELSDQVIPVPVINEDGTCRLVVHTVSLYLLGDSLPAYVLEPVNGYSNPWFVVRGTEMNNVKMQDGHPYKKGTNDSLMADVLHRGGVGEGVVDKHLHHSHFYHDGQTIQQQLSLQSLFKDRRFNLCGHSLGGNIVNQIAALLYSNVEKAYAFSAPAVSDRIAAAWVQGERSDPYKLINIQTQGDPVPAAGRRLIGSHIAAQLLERPAINDAIHMHLYMILTEKVHLAPVNLAIEEEKIGRRFVERSREIVSVTVQKAMNVLRIEAPDWHSNADLYQRDIQPIHEI